MKQQRKSSAFLAGKAVLILLVLAAVLLHTGAFLLPSYVGRLDLSGTETYTLSDQVKEFLANLERDVTVYVLDADGSDKKLEYFMDTLDDHSDRLKVRSIKAKKNMALLNSVGIAVGDQTTEAQWDSLQYSIIVESDVRKQVLLYPDLFYYINDNTTLNQLGITQMTMSKYSSYVQQFNQYAQQDSQYATYLNYLIADSHLYFQGEALLSQAIEYVEAEYIPVSYVLTGHGEADMTQVLLGELCSSAGIAYQTLTLNAKSGIPQDAASILVLAPTSDYTPQEIQAMTEFLERGGQMTFVTGEEHLSMPNLMSLMAAYGMNASAGSVGEEITVTVESETETEGEEKAEPETKTEIRYSVDVTVNTQHDALAEIASGSLVKTTITNGNAIRFGESGDFSLLLRPIFSTSTDAFIGENTAEKGTQILGASAENAKGAHLVWLTGAESFLATVSEYQAAYVEAQSGVSDGAELNAMISNAACVGMMMGWTELSYESDLLLPDATLHDTQYLTTTDSHMGIAIAFTVILPVVIGAAGVLIWYKRKKA